MDKKGIILAGGRGTRLSPLTDVVNKFLHPVYDKLMIEYSVYSLVQAGIKEIAIILGTKSAGETIDYLKSGKKYGVRFTYFYQDEPLGVPHALSFAETWAGESDIVVMCADNIMFDDVKKIVDYYDTRSEKRDALISIKTINNKEEIKKYAVLMQVNGNLELVEKPSETDSNLAFAGIQIYNKYVWEYIRQLKLSDRGEYEIVDVINSYLKDNNLAMYILKDQWFDCGNKDSLVEAQYYAAARARGLV